MYIPKHFLEEDQAFIQKVVADYPFATIIHNLEANHLPFYANWDEGTLYGHCAKANPLAKELVKETDVLVIFHGPHHYVNPKWYGEGEFVPTWNYIVVHFYGKAQIVEDESGLISILKQTKRQFENHDGWNEGLSMEKSNSLLKGIVGIKINIEKIEAKTKISQNREKGAQSNLLNNISDPAMIKILKNYK